MKTLLLFALCCVLSSDLLAQSGAGRDPDPELQARIRDGELEREMAVGRVLPEFTGATLNSAGIPFTRNQLRQRVTLMCFWYASCNCFRPQVLDSFRTENDPRFQIVSIMPDSFMYASFVKANPVPGLHVMVNDRTEVLALNVAGGYPVFLLVDGEGKVLKASRINVPRAFDAGEWRPAIREALMF